MTSPLFDRLARRLRRMGPMTLAEYMATCLYHPEWGYYRRQMPLGAEGDFVTAPEISPLFGAILGATLAQRWDQAGRPRPVDLIELGPGRGSLLRDILRGQPDLAACARVTLVELHPGLRVQQETALQGLAMAANPQWQENFMPPPDGQFTFIIANEYFDALPIHQFVMTPQGWREVGVDLSGDDTHLTRVLLTPGPQWHLSSVSRDPNRVQDGSVLEVSPAAIALTATIAQHMVHHEGEAFYFDYGPAEDGITASGTFQALRHHRPVDPLDHPGEADLTAHVDFSTLRRTALEQGAATCGPIEQGSWLRHRGIEQLAAEVASALSPVQQQSLQQGVDRLCDPHAMGSLFKVMTIRSPSLSVSPGFPAES